MQFTTLGETEEIGASCHYLHLDNTGIILDAGADPEREGMDSMPNFDLIADHPDWPVDHVVVSHAHHDHLGALPLVTRTFPHAHIHMSSATRQLADILLPALLDFSDASCGRGLQRLSRCSMRTRSKPVRMSIRRTPWRMNLIWVD